MTDRRDKSNRIDCIQSLNNNREGNETKTK